MFGMCYAFPTTKSGLWKEEVLPEEVMAELRRPSKDDAATSSFREKQREAARRRSEGELAQFDNIRRKSKDLSEKMEAELQLFSRRSSFQAAANSIMAINAMSRTSSKE